MQCIITLPSRPRVCFKPVTWHIEMHHVRTFFSVWHHDFFVLRDVHFFKRNAYRAFCVWKKFVLIIFRLQLINSGQLLTVLWQTKTTVNFPLEDKHVVNEHHVIRKSHDASHTQKKPSRDAFQCTTWLVWNKLAASKTLLRRLKKKLQLPRSTGKSNMRLNKNSLYSCKRALCTLFSAFNKHQRPTIASATSLREVGYFFP